ncbi:hypothetical protein REPUB_Repub03eG0163700 [Reevesia pubescens]
MAMAFDELGLKPVMLRSLIRHYVPDDKNHPLSVSNNFLELPKLVSILQTHRILSESHIQSLDQKLVNTWKSAVDDWVNRLLLLLSSDMSDKCWVGICLLGVTCQECSNQRFLSSYSVWFDKLLLHIQPPADSQLVKIASCTSISDLLTRLARFPEVKKDGNLLAEKLVQPVLKLLNGDGVEAVWEGAATLLYTIITFFPTSIHHYYERAEAAIASKILSGKYSTKTLKKLGYCLALLPKSKGDKDSWSLMMQKILISINDHLNEAFQGVEEETKSDEARRLLVPPGKDLPSPLGGHSSLEVASCKATRSSERLPTSTVSTLMFCCCKMLTSSYPIQVTAPVRSLLALVERLLMVDGSLPHMLPFMTTVQQELICSELPVLHAYSLELLIAIIKGMHRQLLPHAAYVVRLVTRYFRRCAQPELRIKLYSIIRMLLLSMGVGIAIYLAPDVIDNAFNDLNSLGGEDVETSPANIGPSTGASLQPSDRKRKLATKTGSLVEKQDRTNQEVEGPNTHQMTPITVKIAALDTLEVLLTVGGASKSESWRSSIDSLLIKIATDTCKGGWGSEENNIFLPHESTSIWTDLQLSSLHALLASFLAPARVRPPYLSQGLELFRKGKQEAGTKLAGFCAYALLALEVLIHPKALPLDDFYSAYHNSTDGASNRFPQNTYSSGQKQNTMFYNAIQRTEQSALESHDDDLYERWLQNENENITVENMKDKTSRPNLGEKPYANDSSFTNTLEVSEQEPAATNADVHMKSKDEMMVQAWHIEESIPKSQEIVSATGITSSAVERNPEGTGIEFKRTLSACDGLNHTDRDMVSGDVVLASKVNAFDNVRGNTSSTLSNAEKGNASVVHWESDSSMDSFPAIVNVDPDTDSDEEMG